MQWWALKSWFNPRQKWLMDKIPRQFCDKVELIPLCIFESFKHFVEQEDGLEGIWGERYENDESISEAYREQREPIRKELDAIYEYIKNERTSLQEQLENSYPVAINGGDLFDSVVSEDDTTPKYSTMNSCEKIYGMSYFEAYKEVHRLEALIEEKDTWAMISIIKNRMYLWT
jgi:hypothetical protein